MLLYNWESEPTKLNLTPPKDDKWGQTNTKLVNQLMNIRVSLVEGLPEDTQAVLDVSQYWDWDLLKRTEEFAAQILYMHKGLREGYPLPYTPYDGTSYGRDVLLGKSVLDRE